MHQFSVPMDFAAEVANRELGADEMLLPAEVIDAFGWAPEIALPGPPPPAPPLDEESSPFARRRRRQHRSESHRAPGDVDPLDQLTSIDPLSTTRTSSPTTTGARRERDRTKTGTKAGTKAGTAGQRTQSGTQSTAESDPPADEPKAVECHWRPGGPAVEVR